MGKFKAHQAGAYQGDRQNRKKLWLLLDFSE